MANPRSEPLTSQAGPSAPRRAARVIRLADALGSIWFLLLGLAVAAPIVRTLVQAGDGLGADGWANLLSRLCIAGFYVILCLLLLLRATPVATAAGVMPTILALAGTYLPWVLPFLPAGRPPGAMQVLSAALLVAGGAMIIVTVLHLGRAFSLDPQARRLVRTGPYRVIRHPLYLAEEISICGAALHVWSIWAVALLLVHCALQLRRAVYEERVLSGSFPEYQAYAAVTARLLPGLW
jgi:protein-S-isoprenylcysteine O-methyltransferase Ste14